MNTASAHPGLLIIAPEHVLVEYRCWASQALDQALELLRSHAEVELVTYRTLRELPLVLGKRAGRQLVLVCNDATVNAVVQEMHRRRVLHPDDPIGLLPASNSNDFARAMGIPLDLLAAAQTILDGQARPLDLLVDELGGVVINAATIGLAAVGEKTSADPAQHASAVTQLTHLAAGKTQPPPHAMTIHSHRGWRLRILVDDATLWDSTAGYDGVTGTFDDDSRVFYVAVSNGTTRSTDMPVGATPEPDDGLLDVVVSVATRHEAMELSVEHDEASPAASAASGGSTSTRARVNMESVEQQVRTARGRRVCVFSHDAAFSVLVDGEPVTGVHARTWRVESLCWSVLAPNAPTEPAA